MRFKIETLRTLWLIGGMLLLVIVLSSLLLVRVSKSQAAPEEPIKFNHKLMVQSGVPCLFCHVEAMKSPVAGIPSVKKCMGCHKVIATYSPEVQELAGYWERQEPIPWQRVNRLPRFVHFSHQVHVVSAGLNCERCHGDVGNMTETKAVLTMDMGWCLSCHEQQANATQLRDCLVCHQ